MERIRISDYLRHMNDWVGWFLVSVTAGLPNTNEIIASAVNGEYEIKLTINGHEVPVIRTILKLRDIYEANLRESAEELVSAAVKDKLSILTEAVEVATTRVLTLFEDRVSTALNSD